MMSVGHHVPYAALFHRPTSRRPQAAERVRRAARRRRASGSDRPTGIHHVDVPEPARRTAVTHGVRLAGLALAVVECSTQLVAPLPAHHVERRPEVGSPHLVRDVLQHPGDPAVPDLVEELPAELGIVALLIY